MSESPVKKLNFDANSKENALSDVDLKPGKIDADETAEDAPKVAPGIKAAEANEPLLQENPHRFVLFPIKYHEVSARHA